MPEQAQAVDPMVAAFGAMSSPGAAPTTTAPKAPFTAVPPSSDPMERAFSQVNDSHIDPSKTAASSDDTITVMGSDGKPHAISKTSAGIEDWANDLIPGAAKSVAQSAHTVGRVINAVTGDNVKWLPSSMEQPKSVQTDTPGEKTGAFAEQLAEFALTDGALKGLSIVDKLKHAQIVADFAAKSPFVAKLLGLGLKAVAGGVSGAAVGGLHEGKEGAETGAAMGAGAELAGSAVKAIKGAPKAALSAEDAAQAVTKEIRPPAQEMNDTAKAVEHEMGNIHDYATENELPLNTHHDLAKAARGAADEARVLYQERILDPVADQPVSVAGTNYHGTAVGENQNNATLGDIDKRITEINNELRSAYSKTTPGKTGTALASEGDLKAERSGLTQVLHKELSARTGIPTDDIAALRQRFGRQYTIADNAKAAANQLDIADTDIRRGTSAPLSKTGLVEAGINKVRGGQPAIAGRGLRKALAASEEAFPRTPYPELAPPSPAPFPRPQMVPESAGTEVPSILDQEPTNTSVGAKPPLSQPAPFPRKPIPTSEGTKVPSILDRTGPTEASASEQITRKISDIGPRAEPKTRPVPAWKTAAMEELKNAPQFSGTKVGQVAQSNGDDWIWNGREWRKH